MTLEDVQELASNEEKDASFPDYLTDPDAVLKDYDAKWRYGRPPDYSKTRAVFAQTKLMDHAPGSLEDLVQNLVKNWEVEASFKPDLKEWRTVDHENYSFAINGGPPQPGEHMLKVGTYNAIIPPNEFYSPETSDFASSHKTFKRMMPTFAWEVLEVYSGPPRVSFRWRHWGVMKNDYVGFNDKNEKVTAKAHGGPIDIQGVTVAQVDDKIRIQKLETWFDPMEMFRQIAPNGIVTKQARSPTPIDSDCPEMPLPSMESLSKPSSDDDDAAEPVPHTDDQCMSRNVTTTGSTENSHTSKIQPPPSTDVDTKFLTDSSSDQSEDDEVSAIAIKEQASSKRTLLPLICPVAHSNPVLSTQDDLTSSTEAQAGDGSLQLPVDKKFVEPSSPNSESTFSIATPVSDSTDHRDFEMVSGEVWIPEQENGEPEIWHDSLEHSTHVDDSNMEMPENEMGQQAEQSLEEPELHDIYHGIGCPFLQGRLGSSVVTNPHRHVDMATASSNPTPEKMQVYEDALPVLQDTLANLSTSQEIPSNLQVKTWSRSHCLNTST